MGETEVIDINDTTRAIRALQEALRTDTVAAFDPRIKAMVLTQLEIAELLSFRLIRK